MKKEGASGGISTSWRGKINLIKTTWLQPPQSELCQINQGWGYTLTYKRGVYFFIFVHDKPWPYWVVDSSIDFVFNSIQTLVRSRVYEIYMGEDLIHFVYQTIQSIETFAPYF